MADTTFVLGPQNAAKEDLSDVVLYLLSTDCPICPTNYGFLNDLTESGIPVVGLVLGPPEGAVQSHLSEWEVRFPILVNPYGSALDVVPLFGIPTTILIHRGEVAYLEFGELDTKAEETIRPFTRSWAMQ